MYYRTNLPREIMQIPDFPMKEDEGSSFVHHSVIREYLWDYAKHFNLYPHIKVVEEFKKKKSRITPLNNGVLINYILSF